MKPQHNVKSFRACGADETNQLMEDWINAHPEVQIISRILYRWVMVFPMGECYKAKVVYTLRANQNLAQYDT